MRRGIVAMNASAQDVDEIEARGDGIPDRTLAQFGLCVEHQLDVVDDVHQTRTAITSAALYANASHNARLTIAKEWRRSRYGCPDTATSVLRPHEYTENVA